MPVEGFCELCEREEHLTTHHFTPERRNRKRAILSGSASSAHARSMPCSVIIS